MIAVIFEVEPKPGQSVAYFAKAAALRSSVEGIDGFISVERFESVTQPGKYLSLSFFRDEQAVREWRSRHEHRQAQTAGRNELFEHYRIRVAEIIRDYDEKRAGPFGAKPE